jgi:hypothetical protein
MDTKYTMWFTRKGDSDIEKIVYLKGLKAPTNERLAELERVVRRLFQDNKGIEGLYIDVCDSDEAMDAVSDCQEVYRLDDYRRQD